MEKKEQLYEGKAKKVYATEDPNLVIVSYKDDATAFDGAKKGTIVGKGVINNQMTNRLMAKMEKAGIPTHFVEELSERDTLVKKVSIVPLEVIIRNISAGHFASRYGVEEGIVFSEPTIEFSYKNDDLHDPLMNAYHAVALKLATWEEIELIKKYAFAVNDTLKAFWSECGVTLVDFKLEFGKTVDGQIVLADEISPDTCRLWDSKTNEKARQGPLPPRPRRRGRRLRRSHEAPDGSRRTVRSNMTENHNIIPARHIHEECGVFGIFTPQEADVASYAYYALYSLQHRGQGERGYRRQRRRPVPLAARHWPCERGLPARAAQIARQGYHRRRPCALRHDRQRQQAQRPAHFSEPLQGPYGARAQRQPDELPRAEAGA